MNAKDYLRHSREEKRARKATELLICIPAVIFFIIFIIALLFSLTK